MINVTTTQKKLQSSFFVHLAFVFASFLMSIHSLAQNRDANHTKDYANVFWNPQYTLFDLLTDEAIYPQANGNYKIWYSSNEDPKPSFKELTPQQLQGFTFTNSKHRRVVSDGVILKTEKQVTLRKHRLQNHA